MPALKNMWPALLAFFGMTAFTASPEGYFMKEEDMTKLNDELQSKTDAIAAATAKVTGLETDLQTAKDANKVATDAANTTITGLEAKLANKPIGKKIVTTGAEGETETEEVDPYAATRARIAADAKERAGIKS